MRLILLDIRLGLRNLRRSPLFALAAISSLALGIGANTAVFTLIDQLILRLLPVKDPQQLVMIWTTGPHMGNNRGSRASSYPMYQDFQQKAAAFSDVLCQFSTPLSISFNNQTERVNAELVSGNYFQALGVHPALGRVFSSAEDDRQYKGHPVVVLSHQYWVSRFAADPGVIGKKILVNNYPMVIVGVSAAGFAGLDPSTSPQIRVPIQMKPLMTPGWDGMGERRSQWIHTFARMKPGFTLQSAQASLQPLLDQILKYEITQPEMKDASQYMRKQFLARKIRMEEAANGYSNLRQSYSTALIVLMCMVGLVLLIACFNVANLLIARALSRQKEIAVRLALGASRRQLLRQLLIESLLLSLSGGAAGLLLSGLMIRALLGFLPTGDSPLLLSADLDMRVLTFSAALAVLTGLLFGVAPAFQALQLDIWSTLKDVVGAITGDASSAKLRKGLVVAQVALSFLLLAGAGLFVRTLSNLREMNPGFRNIDNLVTFQLDPALSGYSTPRLKTLYQDLLQDVRGLPGVTSAGFAAVPLLSGSEWDSTMSVAGYHSKDGEDMQAFMNAVSPGYWTTMGEPLLEGRDFDARDQGEKFRVAIVNQKFARHFFGQQSPIGRYIGFGDGPQSKQDIQIIGMVADSLYEGPRDGVHRQVFVPFSQSEFPMSAVFYIRTSAGSTAMFNAIRRQVAQRDPDLPIYAMKTLDHQLDETLSTERMIAALSGAFGFLATLLAAIGLYGVMAFVVARRTKEIGLRMALGASQPAILWMVIRETLLLLILGLAIGVPASVLLSRYVSSQLFGVTPTDIGAAAFALVALFLVALTAGFLPARRASTIDPMGALKYE